MSTRSLLLIFLLFFAGEAEQLSRFRFKRPHSQNPQIISVLPGQSITAAYNAIQVSPNEPAPIIELEPGQVYNQVVTLGPKANTHTNKRIRITTRGWVDKGVGWNGLVSPSDLPQMAVIRGTGSSGAVVTVANGTNAGNVSLFGLAIQGCPPTGNCDLIMVGTDVETNLANMAGHVDVRQVLMMGDPVFGTRRGIRIEGHHVDVTQSWVQEVFIAGQDTQAVASNRGGRVVDIGFCYLQAGAENIMLGGATVPNVDFVPQDWYFHDLILHKPLRWFVEWNNGNAPSVDRQVKNLFELKHARRVVAERILMVNNWAEAQSGLAILLNYSTNGNCPSCAGLEDVVLRDFVVLNSPGGINFQGYSHQLGSNNANKLLRVLVEQGYMSLSGTGRPLTVANVLGLHDITVQRLTAINASGTWLTGDFGTVWTGEPPVRGPGGPMQGLRVLDSIFTRNGSLGITAPAGEHRGTGLASFVDAGLQIAGNVLGDGPSDMNTQINNFNLHRAAGALNVREAQAVLDAALPPNACGTYGTNKGGDCARLNPLFVLLALLPEP